MVKGLRSLVLVALVFVVLIAAAERANAQAVTAVPQVDLNRFTGTWYEIARYPDKHEKHCTGDVFALFTSAYKPRQVKIVTSCQTKTGYPQIRNGAAKGQDKSGDGKLKLSYTWPLWWPFLEKRWVTALGPDYAWALIGKPNHKNLWLLSRTRSLTPAVLAETEAKAEAEGFTAAKITLTPQSGATGSTGTTIAVPAPSH